MAKIMKAIWKFQLQNTDRQTIFIPENAKFLCIQSQKEIPYLWYLVDVEIQTIPTTFRIIGIGHHIETDFNGKHLGSYQLMDGSFVGHVFIEFNNG